MKKKAFTTIELLVSMVVSMILMTMLFILLYHTTSLYNQTTTQTNEDGYTLILLSDIENLTRGCDYVEVVEDSRVLVVHDQNEQFVIDSRDYGVEVKLLADNKKHTINIYAGGEMYCIRYVQNSP